MGKDLEMKDGVGRGGSSGGQGENEEGDPRGRKVRGMRRGWE